MQLSACYTLSISNTEAMVPAPCMHGEHGHDCHVQWAHAAHQGAYTSTIHTA